MVYVVSGVAAPSLPCNLFRVSRAPPHTSDSRIDPWLKRDGCWSRARTDDVPLLESRRGIVCWRARRVSGKMPANQLTAVTSWPSIPLGLQSSDPSMLLSNVCFVYFTCNQRDARQQLPMCAYCCELRGRFCFTVQYSTVQYMMTEFMTFNIVPILYPFDVSH